jgi:hypothetical protein
MPNHARPEPNQAALTEGSTFLTKRPQYQLPTSVVFCHVDRRGIAHTHVALQQHHQGQ